MRTLVLGNNWVCWRCVKFLREQGVEIAGLVLHPQERRRYGPEILASSGVPESAVFSGDQLSKPEVAREIVELDCDLGLSLLFGYILDASFLDLFPRGVINLHPSYLPYNRGEYPNVWSIVERTPAGVSLHYLDRGIDTGDLIAQAEVPVFRTDTGASLYRRLESEAFELFCAQWPLIAAGTARRLPQPRGGTFHRVRDVEEIDEIDLDADYRAATLIDILRARTFPPHPGAYFRDGGRKVYLRLQLLPEEELEGE